MLAGRGVSKRWRALAGAVALATGGSLGSAVIAAAPAGASIPTTATATAASITDVVPGKAGQAGGTVTLTVSNTFTKGDVIQIPIETGNAPAPNTGSSAQAVSYTTEPSVAVTAGPSNGSGDANPQVSEALVTNSADGSGSAVTDDELTLTFQNSAQGTSTDTYSFTLSGIEYTVGSAVGVGSSSDPVWLAPAYSYSTPAGTQTQAFNTSLTSPQGSPVHDAEVVSLTASDTPTGVPAGSTAYPVSPFTVTEEAPGYLFAGEYLLSAAATGSSSSSPLPVPGQTSSSAGTFTGTASVTAKGVTVAVLPASGTCPTSGGTSEATVTANSSGELPICVVSATTGTPGSLTFSSLSYTPPAATGPFDVAFADSNNTISLTTTQPAITVLDNPRIAGTSADDTAAAAAESLYSSTMNGGKGGAAILASDSEYQDALSASFLGNAPVSYQTVSGSGATTSSATMSTPVPILLNPYTPPTGGEATTAAAAAIKKMGVSTVYIVGGTDAISSAVQTQLAAIQVGTSQDLQVERIAGVTAEQTAATVAETPTLSGSKGTLPATPGAYGTYSSGAGGSTSGPATGAVPTAILVDGDEFQDALAASPLAYSDTIPVLLTPGSQPLDANTSAAITKLGVKQVIVVGGTLAVSNSVASTLETDGLSVLRIAGTTFDRTAAELASFELNDYSAPSAGQSQIVEGLDSAATEDGGPGLTVGTSRGDAYQDALSSAQVLGKSAGDISPLLLNSGTGTLASGTADLLSADGTAPAGGLTVYTNPTGTNSVEDILGDVIFGGTLAQTPALAAGELNAIAAG